MKEQEKIQESAQSSEKRGSSEALHYSLRLRVCREDVAFGPGVAELLERIEQTGSLSEACRCMGMAYSKGWKILKRAEKDLGILFVQGARGGCHGGSTVLTEQGKDFLARYRRFEAEVRRQADQIFSSCYDGWN